MSAGLNAGGSETRADPILYNVPADRPPAAEVRAVVLRASDPTSLPSAAMQYPAEAIAWVQIVGVPPDASVFEDWPEGVPVDLVLSDPVREHPTLYRCAILIYRHPVRVTIPVVPGFGKAVKVALSLHFAVKLQIGQPDPPLLDELLWVLDHYLHGTTVDQPVEFFNSVLLGLIHEQDVDLWQIQEEDPARFRFVTDDGEETGAGRLAGSMALGNPQEFVARLRADRRQDGGECATCEHFEICGGYFKWPDPGYGCAGVKTLFQKLREAAGELAEDVAAATDATSSATSNEGSA